MTSWPEIQARQAETFGFLLVAAGRRFDELAQAEANSRLNRALARPALMRLVPFLSPDGARIVDLARRLDISKQAVQKSVADLVALGFAALKRDKADGRARRVCLTPAGVRSYATGLDSLDAVECQLRTRIGDGAMQRLQLDLAKVVEALGCLTL